MSNHEKSTHESGATTRDEREHRNRVEVSGHVQMPVEDCREWEYPRLPE